MIGTQVLLDNFEQGLCRAVAEKRTSGNRAAGVTNAKRGEQSDVFTDLEGVASELAFCKLFNLYPECIFSISPRSSQRNEDTGDAKLHNGKLIDVKATKYPNGKLIAVPWKASEGVDGFALMTGTFPLYTFRGFMNQAELLNNKRLGNLGYGPTYIARQDELVEMI